MIDRTTRTAGTAEGNSRRRDPLALASCKIHHEHHSTSGRHPIDDITEDHNSSHEEPKHVVSAEHARQTLVFYASLVGDSTEPPETVLSDLLADLMHFCDENVWINVDDGLLRDGPPADGTDEHGWRLAGWIPRDDVNFDAALDRATADYEAERVDK